jgi:hypothetical protein
MDTTPRPPPHARSYYHKMFINGQTCCNQDSVVSNNAPCNNLILQNIGLYGLNYSGSPYCPPIVFFQCYNLMDAYCNQVRYGPATLSNQFPGHKTYKPWGMYPSLENSPPSGGSGRILVAPLPCDHV